MWTTVCIPSYSFAKTTTQGDKYFLYGSLGLAWGGFTSSSFFTTHGFTNMSENTIPIIPSKDYTFNINGAGAIGLTGALGFDYIHRSRLFLSAGITFAAVFLPNAGGDSISLSCGNNCTYNVDMRNFYTVINGAQVRSAGTNAFATFMATFKVGYAFTDNFIVYARTGVGYMFAPAQIFVQYKSSTSGFHALQSMQTGGFAIEYGLGFLLYITQSIGLEFFVVGITVPASINSLNLVTSSENIKQEQLPTLNRSIMNTYHFGITLNLRVL